MLEGLAGRIMLSWGWRRWLSSFLAGAIAVLALPPVDFFAAQFVAFPILVWLLDGASGDPQESPLRRLLPAFWTGWWFGFGYFVAGLWWIGTALLVDADTFAWALPIAILGLPAVLAIFYGLAAAFARLFWSDGIGRIAALALGFGLVEWLRSFVLTGFPWNAVGYGMMPVPLMMQSAHVVGLLSMNVLAVFVTSAPALVATRRHAGVAVAAAAILLAAHIGYGVYVLSSAPKSGKADHRRPVFRIVQPAVDQSAKMDASDDNRIFDDYLKLSAAPPASGQARPDYIVWPETAVPFILTENPSALRRIAALLHPGQTLIAGAVRVEEGKPGDRPRYYNSIQVIDSDGEIVAAADKVHLVPFGEYMPFEGFFSALGIPAVAMPGGFTAGSQRFTLKLGHGLVALPLVCYEVIFPDGSHAEGAPANMILNVTNDAWYGHTPGPYQHLQQARLRAVETGLPMIRASNDGISVFSDAYGRISQGIGLGDVGEVDATLGDKNPVIITESGQKRIFWLLSFFLLLLAGFSRKGLFGFRN